MSRIRHQIGLSGLALAASIGVASTDARAQQPPDPTGPIGSGLRGSSGVGDPVVDPLSPGASRPPSTTPGSNYGRPRPVVSPRLKYSGRPKQFAHPLPPLVPYPTSPQARQRPAQPVAPGVPDPQPPPTVATVPQIPRRPPSRVEADPFAPIGIGVGGLRLTPYVEADTGYDTNPNRTPGASQGSWMLRGETGFALKSDWTNNELTGSGAFGYNKYFSNDSASRPDGQAKLDLRVDMLRDTSADFELRGNLTTQSPGTPGIGANVTDRPIVLTTGATAGFTHSISDLQFGLHGLVDRTTNQNGTLSNGAVVNLANGDYTALGAQPRIAYQITPGIIPFIDATLDTRRRDSPMDTLGFSRNSNGLAGRIGTTFELSRILTGQIAAGFAQRSYTDARLRTITAPTVDGSLVWTATPLTTVTMRGTTTINETTVANSSGAVNHTGSVEIAHAFMRNLTVTALGSVGANDYNGVSLRETTLNASIKADYTLTRSIVVRGSFTHERLISTTPGADYTANVFLLGLKLQQ